jgi:tRNA A-37 threonylcarbamoyl transferase component Bud32
VADNVKVIARRAGTPVPDLRTTRSRWQMPADLMSEQVQRLAVFAGVGAGLWTFGLVMDLVFLRIANTTYRPSALVTVIEVLGIVSGLAMFAYVKHVPHDHDLKANAGFAYMLVNALGVALINTETGVPIRVPAMHLSWNAVVVLLFSMIIWANPRKTLVASLAAVSMDPLAVWLGHLRGIASPPPFDVFVLYLPSYICAFAATLPAHFLQRMGSRLREAQELGSYRLVERLGHGGMGEVWRAEHRLLARTAAIKLVRPEVLGAANEAEARLMLRRFEREARATAGLNSPHTIQVFDFGITEEGTFYYVMELLAGRDLESLVREFGPAPADRALFLLRQVCHSLADAHARGLVHRDIKPANIYVCRMGLEYDFVKVLDFGLVKFKDHGPSQPQTLITMDHSTTGTPAYMAPEIILGDADVDRRADVYALGCVAYYLLTGQLVFEADTPMKMLLQHVQAAPLPPSQRTELPIPKELDDLVLACLAKDPNDRPQNAEELFRMATGCNSCPTWDQDAARTWWQTHLPEFTGPLSVGEPADQAADRTVAAY